MRPNGVGSHISLLILCSHRNGNKLSFVTVVSSGHNLECFIYLEHFGLYRVFPLHYLRKSTEFHHMWTECQIIFINFLQLISHELLEIAYLCPILYSLPKSLLDISAISPH